MNTKSALNVAIDALNYKAKIQQQAIYDGDMPDNNITRSTIAGCKEAASDLKLLVTALKLK